MFPVFDSELEIRQVGGKSVISGVFKYGMTGVIRDRGGVRKEQFGPGAFRYAIMENREAKIDILVGHDFGKPLANRAAGSLAISDSDSAVEFEATLPDNPPSWVRDAELAIDAGLMKGLSPGFRVPPRNVVPDAVSIIPEPGNPGVQIRVISAAVLREMSVVTNPVYDAEVELRSDELWTPEPAISERTLWL